MENNREIDFDTYKSILLEIMDSIDKFCNDNDIPYFMLGGTLLGAVRHKGFIPWDDDIDIAIPREDYDRFCETFNQNRNDAYSVICLGNNDKYYLPFAKVIDTRTSLIENAFQTIEIGAYVDVFPIDFFGEDKLKQAKKIRERKSFIWRLRSIKHIKISKKRAFYKNAAIIISHLLCWESVNSIARKIDKMERSISGSKDEKYNANLYDDKIMPTCYIGNRTKLPFEGREYWAPENYDAYLTDLFGDYMQLPPESERVTHHDFTVKWK